MFEAYRVKQAGEIRLETLSFAEAMADARMWSRGSSRRAIVQIVIAERDYYATRGYWLDGVWFE